MAHTPGPWQWLWRQVDNGRGEVETKAVMLESRKGDGTTSTILAVREDWIGWMNNDASAGDRALVAAAPELLAALKSLVQLIGDASDAGALYGKHDTAWKQALDGISFLIERTERTVE
jgi:hypothetical protein